MVGVEMEGVAMVIRALTALGEVAAVGEPIAREMGLIAERSIRRHFEEESAPEIGPGEYKAQPAMGQPWAELAESTVARRRNKDKGSIKKLQDTGRLKQSVTSIVRGNELEVGTGVDYGPYQQEGTGNMPARPFIGIDEADRELMMQVTVMRLKGVL